jgi:uncharacterized protein (UPF0147 family)
MIQRLFIFLFILPSILFSNDKGKIYGTIFDKETGKPIIGANVVIENTFMGSSSDKDGFFIILNVDSGIYSLIALYVGYQTVQINNVIVKQGEATTVNIQLKQKHYSYETYFRQFSVKQLHTSIPFIEDNFYVYACFDSITSSTPLYLINTTEEFKTIRSQDNDLIFKLEYLNKNGEWIRAQTHTYPGCGNTKLSARLKSNHYLITKGYLPKDGTIHKIRYKYYGQKQTFNHKPLPHLRNLISNISYGKISLTDVENSKFDAMVFNHFNEQEIEDILLGRTQLIERNRRRIIYRALTEYLRKRKKIPAISENSEYSLYSKKADVLSKISIDKNEKVRKDLVYCLDYLVKYPDLVLPLLIKMARDSSSIVREQVASTLQLFWNKKNGKAVEILETLAYDSTSKVRLKALLTLNRFKSKEDTVYSLLMKMKNIDNVEIRKSVASALGMRSFQNIKSLHILRELSVDPNFDVRYEVVLSLGKYTKQIESAINILRIPSNDNNPAIRKEVPLSLLKLETKSENAIKLLEDMRNDKNKEVLTKVCEVLHILKKSN